MDGFSTGDEKIFFLGATNRAEAIDEAALRRFGDAVEVGSPSAEARLALLRHLVLNKAANDGHRAQLSDNELEENWFTWTDISEKTDGFSLADVDRLDPAMSTPPAEVVSGLKLTNADDEAMTLVSHRALEEDRRKVFASAFPECASGQVLAIIARGPNGDHKEFCADGATSAELVAGSCQITFEDLSPADCIEYCFAEAPGEWRIAQVSREALETYRGMKFEAWKQMLLKPTCEAQFRRMLQLGIVTQLYDPQLFPTPEAMKSQYQVTDDRTGKLIQLPHAVKEMRVWNAAKQQYDSIDTKLTGAPEEAAKAGWWKDFTDKMKAEHGEEYIAGAARAPTSEAGALSRGCPSRSAASFSGCAGGLLRHLCPTADAAEEGGYQIGTLDALNPAPLLKPTL
eukprot:s3523_g3.t1